MGEDAQVNDVVGDGSDAPQPQPPETVEVRPGMSQDDTDAAVEQGALGTDPEWGPLGLDENQSDEAEGDPSAVEALISAVITGNGQDAEGALALAEAEGYEIKQVRIPIQGKRDLAALEADAIAAADDDEEDE